MNIKRRSFISLISSLSCIFMLSNNHVIHASDFSSFPQALAAILNGGRARRKGWNIYYTLFEDSLWAFGDQGTGVKIECVETQHLLANDWIIESTGRGDQR